MLESKSNQCQVPVFLLRYMAGSSYMVAIENPAHGLRVTN